MNNTQANDQSRWYQLVLLAVAVLFSLSLWFSVSAIGPLVKTDWALSEGGQAWLTMSVQLGFVLGTLFSAITNLADRIVGHKLVAISALFGGLANGMIAIFLDGSSSSGFAAIVVLRFLTGVAMAGVYPPGMKLMASWFQRDRGLAIGILVGALTVGSASPHLFQVVPWNDWLGESKMELWRYVLLTSSCGALVASLLAFLFIRPGPHVGKSAQFNWRYFVTIWKDEGVRRANFGYLGHMWELYAMWASVPVFLLACFENAGWDAQWGRMIAFAAIAIGGPGCVIAGLFADRVGRCWTTSVSMIVSGGCALITGFCLEMPTVAIVLDLIWGFAVVADSAQFSTSVSELCDPQFVGTALTIQTCCGFLLTMITIRLVPLIQDQAGWGWGFAILAIGPAFGVWHMLKLRLMPEAKLLAQGNR